MRATATRLTLLAAALVLASAPCGAQSEFQSSLTATVSLRNAGGALIGRAVRNEPFRIEVALRDAALVAPPKGVALKGWIRRKGKTNSECREAARAFRATRSLPLGAVDLNGVLLLQLNRDGSLGVLDPKLDLRSSNMLAAAKFETPPSAFAIDRRSLVAYLAFADPGAVVAVSLLDGATRTVASGLKRPSGVLLSAAGDVWIAEEGGVLRIAPDGRTLARHPIEDGTLVRLTSSDTMLVAYTPGGHVAAFDLTSGARAVSFETGTPIPSAALARDGAFATLEAGGEALALRFLDDPENVQRAPLRASATWLAASPAGRQIFAGSSAHGGVSIVDVASGRQVSGFATDNPITDTAFTERYAYFLNEGQTMAFALDLASVAISQEPKMRAIPLATDSEPTSASLGLIADMRPSESALAVNAASRTAFVIEEAPAYGPAPPMNAVRLRGGVPLGIGVVDRSFREAAPGRFEAHARLEKGGDYELVLTTGVSGMTMCTPLTVEGPENPQDRSLELKLRVSSTGEPLRARRPQRVALDFVDAEGRAYTIESVELSIPSLSFSWSARVPARTGPDGRLTAEVTLPYPGPYAVQPILPETARATVSPGFIEARQ